MLLVCYLTFTMGCQKSIGIKLSDQILFLGHIYQPGKENRIDRRIETVRFDKFAGILLGGDICVETTKDPRTLLYLDRLFNLSKAETFWAIGNHDVRNGSTSLISDATGRPFTYYQDFHGLRILVLNTTELSNCQILEQQAEIISEAISDIDAYEAILIVSHHAIWTALLEQDGISQKANAKHSIWRNGCNGEASSFENSILPQLLDVANNEKQVTWISGDFGQRVSAFEHQYEKRLWFVGNGLDVNKGENADSVLLLQWQSDPPSLSWNFEQTKKFSSDN